MNGVIVSTTLVPVTASIGTFTALLPELSDVRKSSKADPSTVKDVRVAEVTATLLVLSIGVACGMLVNSPYPAIAAALASGSLVLMYESVLSIPPIK